MHPSDFDATLSTDAAALETSKRVVRVRWLGTAGYEIACHGHVILIDPYLTRVGLGRFLFRRISPDLDRIAAARIERADAIFVGHSHFDHVLDVPVIAEQTGARVYGSRSTANLMQVCGLPEAQVVACAGRTTVEVGPFKVTLVPSEHSRFALGGKVPYAGDIPCSCELPIRGRHYKCGDVFAIAVEVDGTCLYHMGSANLVDSAIVHRDVDVFLVGISGRHATDNYVQRILKKLTPRLVVPMHYDNFFRPLDRDMKLLPMTKFGRFVDEVVAFDREIDVKTLTFDGAFDVPV